MATNTRKVLIHGQKCLKSCGIVSDSKEKHTVNINMSDLYSSQVLAATVDNWTQTQVRCTFNLLNYDACQVSGGLA